MAGEGGARMTTAPTPAAFIGHGSPMNALETNRYTQAWRAFGAAGPRPRAVLVVSAHWYIGATAVTAMSNPRTIHDFYGFPDELFAFDYPAVGASEVAEEIADVVRPRWVGLDRESWGLDHGTWSVLAHVFPEADVPVLQLSINALKDVDDHLDLAARLSPLRDRGVMIVGSGNVVHNLRRLDLRRIDHGFDWARRFDDAARDLITTAPENVGSLKSHPDYALAVPTPEHFIPLIYVAGLAASSGRDAKVLVDGYFAGGISMTSYALDVECPHTADRPASAALPDTQIVPADDTNT
jgi:4,5-DOPA dioxygenase extradiol